MIKNKVIVILGPTASGKTKLAVELAKKLNGEIISADSRQVYRGMDIGTGKDLDEYGGIRYHLIDVVDPNDQFSLADYQKLAYQAIEDALKRGKLPIVCGGTGLYISAVVEGYVLPETCNTKHVTQNIRKKLDEMSLDKLLVELEKIDPETFAIIDQKNRRRVQRALEIFYQTGVTKSAQISKQKPPYDFLQIGINLPKKTLYQKIDTRLIERLKKEGMIDEIKNLHENGVSWQRLDDFGLEYRYVSRYLQAQLDYQEMVKQLKQAIRQYTKRQMTWFRRDKNIIWVDQKLTDIDHQIKNFILN
ncbi:MAG: tRNA (adenosine(37)-N6)-dimethylallyltransferase MiaA [Candidatus Buchananbacteria bacterium]|nr:tRNA (adenosine(37)-N6)-dimethylallyltransferase MiaA [Candidatus Buchananbacteria bacterium]